MTTFKGLVFVRQGAIGTRMEGPDYFLQTHTAEHPLERKTQTEHWMPDYLLEFYSRRWVEIEGELQGKSIAIKSIHEICTDRMPT